MTGRHVIGAVLDDGPGAFPRRERVELVRGGPLSDAEAAALVAALMSGPGTSGEAGTPGAFGGAADAPGGFGFAGASGAVGTGEPFSAWHRAAIAEGVGARAVTSAPFVPAAGWRS